MAYYNTCPKCGANLDPGEPCDCEVEEKSDYTMQNVKTDKVTGQYVFCLERVGEPSYAYTCRVGR